MVRRVPDRAFSRHLERRLGPEFGEEVARLSATVARGLRTPRTARLARRSQRRRARAAGGRRGPPAYRSGEPRDGLGERALRGERARELPPRPCLRRTRERVAE